MIPSSFSERFARLDSLLTATRQWWQNQPYHHTDFCFAAHSPALVEALLGLSDEQVLALEESGNELVAFLSPWIVEGSELQQLAALPQWVADAVTVDPFMARDTPGRKWEQILAFTGVLPAHQGPWLEWCAGKGHLGRVVSLTRKAPVTSLEWQAMLCSEGTHLAQRDGAQQQFVHGDAFSAEAAALVHPEHHALALHACGELHMTLMRHVAARGARGVTLSPCCYHLISSDTYQPMSRQGRRSALLLGKADLRLPLQETVTAGARVRRLRQQEVSWRLAFDSLQREVRGIDSYLAVPNMQKSLLSGSFEAFCRWAADARGITLPAQIDAERWLAQGARRARIVLRTELVRQLFRRPLELWLVLDRACYLQEQGYRVALGEFCARPLTPRNIVIRAERPV